jgi:hypothetical protein
MQNLVIIAVMLSINITAFTQIVGLSGFEVFDDGSYMLTVNTEKEAVERYRSIVDMNGCDTTSMVIDWGNNQVIFDSFKADAKGMVNVGIIVRFEGKYDILFATIKKKKNHLFDVIDNDGVIVELTYE